MEKNGKEEKWINCAKFLAIFAVIIDHTKDILYVNENVAFASYFSVSLFIIISGMLSFTSNERHNLNWFKTFVRSGGRMAEAYLVANAICLIWLTKGFDVKEYLGYVFSFSLCPPFYYVLLYLQLMLVSRLVYSIVKCMPEKLCGVWEFGVGIIILCLCSWTTNHTNVLGVYGGGGKVLGGTYLFLFYVGMLISKHNLLKNMTHAKSAVISVVGIAIWFAWWRFECLDSFALDSKLPFGEGFNPPGITLFVFAMITLVMSYGVFSLLEYFVYLRKIVDFISWMGKHTLYIFLYHSWLLDCMEQSSLAMENIWLKRVIYILIMIFFPILLDYLFKWLKNRMDVTGRCTGIEID